MAASVASAGYTSCRCTTANNGGKAGGNVDTGITASTCEYWNRNKFPAIVQGTACQAQNGGEFDGPAWWDACVQYGAQAGQCS